MSNKRIFRIAKNEFFGMGPYCYFNLHTDKDSMSNEEKYLNYLIISKERWFNSKVDIWEKIKKYPIFENQGIFSSFKTHRPGIWDDPVLKQSISNKYPYRIKDFKDKNVVYKSGFDSLQQLKNWFNDEEELSLMFSLGFRVYSKLIPTNKIFYGLKQVLIEL
jgi:hypothetical protein